uniref:Uncharacterized protein n=1 Tax=Clastoptera arizonana TaxID=38151 RepID=A0A1B6DKT4_9HEMI
MLFVLLTLALTVNAYRVQFKQKDKDEVYALVKDANDKLLNCMTKIIQPETTKAEKVQQLDNIFLTEWKVLKLAKKKFDKENCLNIEYCPEVLLTCKAIKHLHHVVNETVPMKMKISKAILRGVINARYEMVKKGLVTEDEGFPIFHKILWYI